MSLNSGWGSEVSSSVRGAVLLYLPQVRLSLCLAARLPWTFCVLWRVMLWYWCSVLSSLPPLLSSYLSISLLFSLSSFPLLLSEPQPISDLLCEDTWQAVLHGGSFAWGHEDLDGRHCHRGGGIHAVPQLRSSGGIHTWTTDKGPSKASFSVSHYWEKAFWFSMILLLLIKYF